jgi:hypothetical protein
VGGQRAGTGDFPRLRLVPPGIELTGKAARFSPQ